MKTFDAIIDWGWAGGAFAGGSADEGWADGCVCGAQAVWRDVREHGVHADEGDDRERVCGACGAAVGRLRRVD